ncbi:MAG: ABC transporter ATP-binding protein, partial [Clostridia bacterium]|nr:ABC transporter ATP-binding protein [Clostridia bacterium]
EPNSALDPISEATVYKQVFDAVKEDQTLILITHRLGAIRHVDRIIVMDHGRIIEDGSHDNLMEQKGKYFEMYNAQAKWYEV